MNKQKIGKIANQLHDMWIAVCAGSECEDMDEDTVTVANILEEAEKKMRQQV